MSRGSESQASVQLTVVSEFTKNYRIFRLQDKKRQAEKRSNLKKIYSEQVEPSQQHPHKAASTGFS